MAKFPKDAPKKRVIKALKSLGFSVVREKEHIAMERLNEDGAVTPLTMPNNRESKVQRCARYALNQESLAKSS